MTKDIPSGSFVLGAPALPYEKFTKLHAHFMRLPELKEKLTAIDARVAKLEQSKPAEPAPPTPPTPPAKA